MNKNQLIRSMSKHSSLTQKECAKCLEALQYILTESLKRGEDVCITGFGKFYTKFQKPRKGINPATRGMVQYPSKFVPSFKSSAVLRQKFT